MTDATSSSASADLPPRPVGDSPPAKPTSRWEDFVDIFYAPSQVFARREHSGFAIPMLVVTLLVGAIFLANSGAMQPVMDAEFTRATAAAMRKNPQLTPETMAKGRAFGETFAKIGAFVFTPIVMFLIGLCLWVVGKFVGARQTLTAAVMVAAYSYVPRVLEAVINGAQALVMDPASLNGRYRLSIGPARFLDPDTASPLMVALLGRMDLFTIWVTVLLAIGLAVTGRIPRSRAAIAAVVMWFVGAITGLLGALRS